MWEMPTMDANNHSSQIFAGNFRHSLDEKKRVTIPARWRSADENGEFFAMLAGYGDDLVIILAPGFEMERVRKEIQENDEMSPQEKNEMMDEVFGNAFPAPVDKQGRIVIREEFCDALQLQGEVVLVGVGARIKVHSAKAWDATQKAKDTKDYSKIANAFGL
ncbi:MAG: hypothetical protein AAF585_04290 [Verrucomicrobiota bacterium]